MLLKLQMDEQLADETYEQFEERVLNKRAAAMFNLVKAKLQLADGINLKELITRCNKKQVMPYLHTFEAPSSMFNVLSQKQVAQKFYTLLVLKKNQAVELDQTGCYADIMISRGRKFDCPSL